MRNDCLKSFFFVIILDLPKLAPIVLDRKDFKTECNCK